MMTVYGFTLSENLKGHWYPFNIVEDMWADVKHMAGFDSLNCTVSDNDHSLRGHLADLVVDALRLLPAAVIVALVVAGFITLPVFGTNGNQPNTEPVLNAPVIVPPLVWPATLTPTATPTLTPTPTITPSPTPTPIVFAREEECDPLLSLSAPGSLPVRTSFLDFIYRKTSSGGGPPLAQGGYSHAKGENWFTLRADTLGVKGIYALERAEWEPFFDSNRYCQVGGQWVPLPPYEDLRILYMPP